MSPCSTRLVIMRRVIEPTDSKSCLVDSGSGLSSNCSGRPRAACDRIDLYMKFPFCPYEVRAPWGFLFYDSWDLLCSAPACVRIHSNILLTLKRTARLFFHPYLYLVDVETNCLSASIVWNLTLCGQLIDCKF